MSGSASGLRDHVGYWLRRLSDEVHLSFERKLAAHGVTVAQWTVLVTLYRGEGATVAEVARFIEAGEATEPFYRQLRGFLEFCLPNYRRENRAYLTIGIGCTGGRHRSVYVAERLARDLAALGYPVRVSHRDEALD